MDLINPELLKYAESHTTPESPLLQKISRETHLKVLRPRMLSGHLQGRILSLFSKLIRPRYVLEIGAYTGYSALCMAEGLRDDGKLITIDVNEELESMTSGFFREAGLQDKIELIIGNASEIIPQLPYRFDMVFIDADKESYLDYYHMVVEKVNPGGVILADNVLWSGKVVEEPKASDKNLTALLEFNAFIQQDDRVENVLVPVRDGIMAIRKKD